MNLFVGELVRAGLREPMSPPMVTMDTVLTWMLPYLSVSHYSLRVNDSRITVAITGTDRASSREVQVQHEDTSIGQALCGAANALASEIGVSPPAFRQ